jgi:hypothetical protein
MGKVKDIAGEKFGRWTVLSFALLRKGASGNKGAFWWCQCACGEMRVVEGSQLRKGNVKSCGCLRKDHPNHTTHGFTNSPTYRVWTGMMGRCEVPGAVNRPRYGGRGIKVCERWHKFENFLADMGKRPDGLTLDRINNDGNYEPGNCRWATWSEQQRNKPRRTHCKRGHEFTLENTIFLKGQNLTYRNCKECSRAYHKKYEARRRAVQRARKATTQKCAIQV